VNMSDAVEVREVTRRDVNGYLERGYELLCIQGTSQAVKYPEGNQGGYYIRRRLAYVVGRSAEVEPWEVPVS